MGNAIIRTFLLLVTIFVFSCTEDRPRVTSVHNFADPNMAKDFKLELNKANIPYKVTHDKHGKEDILVDSKFGGEIRIIRRKIYDKKIGTPPPEGRSAQIGPRLNPDMIQNMKSLGIPFSVTKYNGYEYVVWEEEYTEKVEQIYRNRRLELAKHKKRFKQLTASYSNAPQWSPESKQDLPLSINEAIDIAFIWGGKKWPKAPGIKVSEIKMYQALSGDNGIWWNYKIYVLPEPYVDSIINKIGSEIIIRMNGVIYSYKDVGSDEYVLTSSSAR